MESQDPSRSAARGPLSRRLGSSVAVLLCVATSPCQGAGEQVSLVRETLARWTETQQILSKEKLDWRLGKETLEARIDVVQRELESLRKRIGEAESSIAEADQKREELMVENERRKVTAQALEQRIASLEQRALKLLPRCPEPLRERIAPLSQRLPTTPEKAAESKLSLSERYQNVIGVLNDISKWNREVTVMTEVRKMTDGSSLEVAVVYVGLGQGYYCGGKDKDGKCTVGGIGTATADGWVWKADDRLAQDVQTAIAVFRNEQLAKLVRLPVQVL